MLHYSCHLQTNQCPLAQLRLTRTVVCNKARTDNKLCLLMLFPADQQKPTPTIAGVLSAIKAQQLQRSAATMTDPVTPVRQLKDVATPVPAARFFLPESARAAAPPAAAQCRVAVPGQCSAPTLQSVAKAGAAQLAASKYPEQPSLYSLVPLPTAGNTPNLAEPANAQKALGCQLFATSPKAERAAAMAAAAQAAPESDAAFDAPSRVDKDGTGEACTQQPLALQGSAAALGAGLQADASLMALLCTEITDNTCQAAVSGENAASAAALEGSGAPEGSPSRRAAAGAPNPADCDAISDLGASFTLGCTAAVASGTDQACGGDNSRRPGPAHLKASWSVLRNALTHSTRGITPEVRSMIYLLKIFQCVPANFLHSYLRSSKCISRRLACKHATEHTSLQLHLDDRRMMLLKGRFIAPC